MLLEVVLSDVVRVSDRCAAEPAVEEIRVAVLDLRCFGTVRVVAARSFWAYRSLESFFMFEDPVEMRYLRLPVLPKPSTTGPP